MLLSAEHLHLAGIHKLNLRFVGPFVVKTRVARVAYLLKLPPTYATLFSVFHVSKLWAYCDDGGDRGTVAV